MILRFSRSSRVKRIAVIGPNADKVLVGGLYDPLMPYTVTPEEGIRRAAGSGATGTFTPDNKDGAAAKAAKDADVDRGSDDAFLIHATTRSGLGMATLSVGSIRSRSARLARNSANIQHAPIAATL